MEHPRQNIFELYEMHEQFGRMMLYIDENMGPIMRDWKANRYDEDTHEAVRTMLRDLDRTVFMYSKELTNICSFVEKLVEKEKKETK